MRVNLLLRIKKLIRSNKYGKKQFSSCFTSICLISRRISSHFIMLINKFSRPILFSFLMSICVITAKSQTPASEESLKNYFEGYNAGNYTMMRETMAGPLKLLLTEKKLEMMYGGLKAQMGHAKIKELKWKSSSVKADVLYQCDTTEAMNYGFTFSKKGKIIGLGGKTKKFTYEKKEDHAIAPNTVNRIDSLVNHKHIAGSFNGCVTVVENNEVIYEKCYGPANRESGEKLQHTTVFEIASCSKAFTAMCVLLLQQQGKISVKDPIVKYIPELKMYKGVTIEHLVAHTGGIPDYMILLDEHWDKKNVAINEDVVKLLAKYHPKKSFSPGKEHEYSNTGYVLLGVIVERVSSLSLAEFMKKEIFDPLAMTSSRIYNTRRSKGEILDNYAFGYIRNLEKNSYSIPDSLPDYDYVYFLDGITGDGTVNTNVRDLVKWDAALRKPGIFTQETLDLAFKAIPLASGESTEYAYGWGISEKEGYETIIEHSGSWPGYTSYILRFKDKNRAVIVLSNAEYLYMSYLANGIAKLLE